MDPATIAIVVTLAKLAIDTKLAFNESARNAGMDPEKVMALVEERMDRVDLSKLIPPDQLKYAEV